jgi:CheY-like chemotaxis protein
MKTNLTILLIEDAAADAELIARELEASGLCFDLHRVETEDAFRHELENRRPDLILSDHGLPSFSGFKALEIVRNEYPGLPFIFVSGSNDPNMVAQMYEGGATDYVFKQDLGDLRAAVLQAFRTGTPAEPGSGPSGTTPEQRKPNLASPARQSESPSPQSIGRLWFCPRCHKLRDAAGRLTAIEDYACTRAEVLVHQEVCADCK